MACETLKPALGIPSASTFPATDDLHGDLEAGAEVRIDILVKGRAHVDGIRSADLPFQIERVSDRMPLLLEEAMPTAIFIDLNPCT